MPMTLEEEARLVAKRAARVVAEKHYYDKAQPFFPLGFTVFHRNPGHWDVTARETPGQVAAWQKVNPDGVTTQRDGQEARVFRIRGVPGKVVVYDERWDPHRPHPRPVHGFKSVLGAMLWIAEELMQEPNDG